MDQANRKTYYYSDEQFWESYRFALKNQWHFGSAEQYCEPKLVLLENGEISEYSEVASGEWKEIEPHDERYVDSICLGKGTLIKKAVNQYIENLERQFDK